MIKAISKWFIKIGFIGLGNMGLGIAKNLKSKNPSFHILAMPIKNYLKFWS